MQQLIVIFLITICSIGCDNGPYEVYDNSRTHDSLVGTWAGKWDDKFKVIFVITKEKDSVQYSITYEWEEKIGKTLEKVILKANIVNKNTIDTENISIRIDPWNVNRALAFGKFSSRTRIANLTRQTKAPTSSR